MKTKTIIGVLIALVFLYILYIVYIGRKINYAGSHDFFKVEDISFKSGTSDDESLCPVATFTLTKNLTTDFTHWKGKPFVTYSKSFGKFSGFIDTISMHAHKVLLTSKCLDLIPPAVCTNTTYTHDDDDNVIVLF